MMHLKGSCQSVEEANERLDRENLTLKAERDRLACELEQTQAALTEMRRKLEAINTPELLDFQKAVLLEAQHQRLRWGSEHDAGKEPQDWFWLIGYLAGKALRSHLDGDTDKALHHAITVAAACANWHAAILGVTDMRPGIDPVERGIEVSPVTLEEAQAELARMRPVVEAAADFDEWCGDEICASPTCRVARAMNAYRASAGKGVE